MKGIYIIATPYRATCKAVGIAALHNICFGVKSFVGGMARTAIDRFGFLPGKCSAAFRTLIGKACFRLILCKPQPKIFQHVQGSFGSFFSMGIKSSIDKASATTYNRMLMSENASWRRKSQVAATSQTIKIKKQTTCVITDIKIGISQFETTTRHTVTFLLSRAEALQVAWGRGKQ